jgi:hypothetical protein
MDAAIVFSLFGLLLVAALLDGVDSRRWSERGWWPGTPR